MASPDCSSGNTSVRKRLYFSGTSSDSEAVLSNSEEEYDIPRTSEEESSENQLVGEKDETTIRPTITTPMKMKKARWRNRNQNSTQKMKRQVRRNKGSPYVSDSTKKSYAAKKLGPNCKCKKQCWVLTENQASTIFNSFWNMSDFNTQNAYLFSCIKANAITRKYVKKRKHADESRRSFTYSYSVNVSGKRVDVCRDQFLSLHGLHNNRGRLRNIQKMVNTGSVQTDGRGKHSNRPNKYSDERVENVRTHIRLIPKYQSHYSRSQNPTKVYLNCDLTIQSLYKDYYVPWCNESGLETVSADKYRRIFCTEFNIGFKIPQSDTCNTCDKLTIAIENASTTLNDLELRKLEAEHKAHLLRAEGMKNLLQQRAEEARENADLHVITMDLQQALPTPMLTSGPAFYKRKLWTFNFGVHDCAKEEAYMFLWNETVAKRGSDEIVSCIMKYLQISNANNAKNLVVFSDNCAGQNKNWNIMAFWHHLVTSGQFDSVEHCFLIPGHTFLPSDRDFSRIEKFKRAHCGNVYTTYEWKDIILKSCKKKPFKVTTMEKEDIFNATDCFLNKIRKRTTADDKLPLKFANIHSFKFLSETPGKMYVKFSVNGEAAPVTIAKRGRPADVQLTQKYREPIPIDSKKFKDLRDLLQFIPPVHHSFYNTIKCKEMGDVESDDDYDCPLNVD